MKQNRNRVGFAIIGTGTVAIRHARAIEEIECAELVAVHDVDQDRARSFALEHNTGAMFHLQDLLANDHIDVVTVATPSGASDPKAAGYKGHKQQFQDMARAILEKREPLISGREGRRALELICGIYESARSGQPYKFVK